MSAFAIHRLNDAWMVGRQHPGAPKVAAFIGDTFHRSSGRPIQHLARAMNRPGLVVLVASPVDDAEEFLGWLAAVPTENRVIYAYVKFRFRWKRDEESDLDEEGRPVRFHIGRELAGASGLDLTKPVKATFWSRTAGKIAAKHPRLLHVPEIFTQGVAA